MVLEVDRIVRVGELCLRTRRMIVSRTGSVYLSYVEAPTRQLHSMPIGVSRNRHTGKQTNYFGVVIHMQQLLRKVPKPASKAVLSGMQLARRATRRIPHVSLCT